MRRCLAEIGVIRGVLAETNDTFGKLKMGLGEAERPAIQTVHFAASDAFACWCETNANADQNVSIRHSHAMRFEIDLIMAVL